MFSGKKKVSIFKKFLLNTSFHGYRYIVEPDRHWTERIFWLVCCSLSWIGAGLLILSAYEDYSNNAISFVVDTNYLDWDTNFPSVVICETDNQDKVANVTDRIFGDPHDYNLDEVVRELVFFKGHSFFTLQMCVGDTANKKCFLKNMNYYHDEARGTCEEIFKLCKWNKVEFDCCTYFNKIDTDMGRCYGINSMQTRVKNTPLFNMMSNKKLGTGFLYLELLGKTNLYTSGALEVPSLSSLAGDIIQLGQHIRFRRTFSIKEIDNHPKVKYVNIDQRKCRFPEESDLDVYRYYSYSACCVQCRKNAQMRLCGCIHHIMPNTPFEQQCDFEGIKCLNEYYNEISIFKASWSNGTGLVCGCLPSCNEIEITIIRDDRSGFDEDYSIVELILERLPTERFKRNVVRGKLDLIVSMGGATALFLGASILSFVEILHYFIVTPISDYIRGRTKKKVWTINDSRFIYRNNRVLPTVS